jgi:hypothetical protein
MHQLVALRDFAQAYHMTRSCSFGDRENGFKSGWLAPPHFVHFSTSNVMSKFDEHI